MMARAPFVVVTLALILPILPALPGEALTQSDTTTTPPATLRYEALLRERAALGIEIPIILHFADHAARDAAQERLDATPLDPLPALIMTGATAAILDQLDNIPGATFVEAADKPIRYAIASARQASRADLVTGDTIRGIAGLTTNEGTPIDGRGIGVAIVDTGIDTTHPDLQGRIAGTWIATPTGVIAAPDSDPVSPHGTHVAGVIAGTGALDPHVRGVAPGATIHSIDAGPSTTNLFVANALAWILENKDNVEPPIRVVVNAWGCYTGPCRVWDPEQAHNQLASALAENGTIVLYAVGNEGGNGFVSTVNPEATNPTPGIIGVAEYSDEDIGTRDACTTGTTARGAYDDATTWPEVSVPGAWVWSPNGVYVGEDPRVPVAERKAYTYFHGTSAAAAHLGGIAALALQANPALTPHAFEYLVKSSVSKIDCGLWYVAADASHPWGTTHPRAGHGLIDAHALVTSAMKKMRIPRHEPTLESPPEEWLARRAGVAIEQTYYFTADGGLAPTPPVSDVPHAHPVNVDAPIVFTSPPLSGGTSASAARIDVWWGTFRECVCARANAGRFGAFLDVVHLDGDRTSLGMVDLNSWYVHPAFPTQRPLEYQFPAIQFQSGDRLQVTVGVVTPPGVPILSTDFVVYTDARPTASRLAIGHSAAPQNGDTIWCQVRQDCTEIGGARMAEGLHCDNVPMRVDWRGPPGSSIVLTCGNAALSCTIPHDLLRTDDSCSADLIVNPTLVGDKTATCRYTSPTGGYVHGFGRCVGLVPREGGD